MSPLLFAKFMRERVEELLKTAFENHPELFLIDLSISSDNRIRVIMDGDKGVTVDDCVTISRAIEHHLDETDDVSIEVMSAGLSEPLKLPRQYRKNIGRSLSVTKIDGEKIEGELISATEDECVLQWTTREPKPIGKGKITVTKEAVVPYKDIKEAKVMITF